MLAPRRLQYRKRSARSWTVERRANAYTDSGTRRLLRVKMDASHTDLAIDILTTCFSSRFTTRPRSTAGAASSWRRSTCTRTIRDVYRRTTRGRDVSGSTLGWNIAGPREIIKSVTRDQLIAYRDAYHTRAPGVSSRRENREDGHGQTREDRSAGEAPIGRDVPFAPFVAPEKLPFDPSRSRRSRPSRCRWAFRGLPQGHADIPAAPSRDHPWQHVIALHPDP